MTPEIDHLVGKLDELAARDTKRRIFGAEAHEYRRKPVDGAALDALAAEAGFAVPTPYRAWMQQVGPPAGPDYGLWSPDEAIAHLRTQSPGHGGQVCDPTEIVAAHLNAMAERLRAGVAPGDACITTDSLCGAVPIGHQGCNGYWYLALAGAFAGCIFGESCDCIGEPWTAGAAFWPAGVPEGRVSVRPPTFLDWIEDWLDRSLAETDTL